MFSENFIREALIAAPAILFSLTVHEFFHAYIAYRFGDNTAKDMGRLTLNPLAHLDLFGTLMMFLSGFRFGWAKPVPINPYNLRNPRKADLWISAAGPFSNLGLGLIFGLLFRFAHTGSINLPLGIIQFLSLAVRINISLAFFNLIPLFPLDGSHILRSLLPVRFENALNEFERFAPFVLMFFILVVDGVGFVLGPFIRFFVYLFAGIRIS
jgi:Zn-dependent protease